MGLGSSGRVTLQVAQGSASINHTHHNTLENVMEINLVFRNYATRYARVDTMAQAWAEVTHWAYHLGTLPDRVYHDGSDILPELLRVYG